jgi:RNA polymerase sigma-70 factor (ECF subfamily)
MTHRLPAPRSTRPPRATPTFDRGEAVLVGRLTRRDETAYRQVVELLHTHLYRLARAHVGDAATAEDIVQETWLAVVSGVDGFRRGSSLRTWTMSIARNLAINTATRDARCRPLAAPLTEGELGAEAMWTRPAQSPEETLLAREKRDAIARAIAALPPKQRKILTLCDLEGATREEACRHVEVSAGNQRVLLHRARAKVRTRLAQADAFADPSPSAASEAARQSPEVGEGPDLRCRP